MSVATRAVLPSQPVRLSEVRSEGLQAWLGAKIRPVSAKGGRHTIHSYFNSSPESPDGRHVLFYASPEKDGHSGEIRLLERSTGREFLLASGVTTEDAHRAACQQWFAGGRKVAFHDFRGGRWVVAAIDIATGEEKILAEDRQIGFGAACGEWVPIYGAHWKQGPHRDLELVHVETGEIHKAVRVEDVLKTYRREIVKMVGEGDVSIFFPVMSPDGRKVMFKISRGKGGDDFRSPGASDRRGKFVYDLETGRPLCFFQEWGHPSWMPDSGGIFEKGQVLVDLRTGIHRSFAEGSPSDHPSVNPDGSLFVTDGKLSRWGGEPDEWGLIVGDLRSNEYAIVHRFDHSGGASSWRKVHPHPAFSADGKRIYFNASSGDWTGLQMAEISPS